ncbi:hypothetical protein, variant 1 [Aphanomyces astaci]|uniref:Uncharacterized protein n=1 Tax=Aphanomyces astaci TaxID=112090 RepID=W4FFU0_APHAT|nr:hypothetical protein, variant 1 [Aphanomyces astaci]ETV65593.1 hypothetical protein, variant 1 [Aphanomyces astaci]|eukprot:XP_009844935.1 hypothetical protein, variant 1 [Aphanomyces astaci]
MEAYLRGASGWRLVPPILDHIAACQVSLLDELIAKACDKQSSEHLVRVMERAATSPSTFDLSNEQMQNVACSLPFIVRGLALQNLTYPMTDSTTPSDETAAWNAALAQLQRALGSIPHRDVVAITLLKRWKRHLKLASSHATAEGVSSSPHKAFGSVEPTFEHLNWKLRLVMRGPPTLAPPSVSVRLQWAAASDNTTTTSHVMDLTVSAFQELHASWQALAVAMGDQP